MRREAEELQPFQEFPGLIVTPEPTPIRRMGPIERLLRDAKALIDEPGKWCRQQMRSPDGRYCSIGALNESLLRLPKDRSSFFMYEREMAMQLLAEAIYAIDGYETLIDRFNDTRSHREVMDAWDSAIARAERECR